MARLTYSILKDKVLSDKTWNVFFKFSHNGETRYFSSTMYVEQKDLTEDMRIKNRKIIDKCEKLISIYRKIIDDLYLEINPLPIDVIVNLLKDRGTEGNIDFVQFAKEWCKRHKNKKGIRNYKSAINSLCRFFGREYISVNEITARTMKQFEESLDDKPRAKTLYTSAIVKLFNDAIEFYNNEDYNIIRIRHTLDRYKAPKQRIFARKRAISTDKIKEIFKLEYDGILHKGNISVRDLAKDCFMLSFCLMGINSADLFNATEYDGEYITYNRTKTKDRRVDCAEIKVRIPYIVKHLVEKYRGEKRVFNFYERYRRMENFNRAINMGLKQIGKEIGIENLQFYSARHSMATIALNKVGIDKYTLNDMLNHIDQSMRITDIYIEKDFTQINKANARLMEYMFGYHSLSLF